MSKRCIFSSQGELDAALAHKICTQLQAGLDTNGKATLVVSGGSTPKGLFAALSSADLDWKNVTVLLADERWVDESHADSNTAMVKRLLLQGAAADAKWIDFGAGNIDVEHELDRVKREVAELGAFDVVILGMGNDSHTASLFPCSIELDEGLTTDAAALMTQPTTAPHRRLSLSKARLLDTKIGIVHIVGSSKLDVFDTATKYADDDVHPISHFYHHAHFSLWFAE
jgi:6-phosphogluconolactonase